MTTQFVPTATNMVALVRSIIQGYRGGPIRALAQEPVQNSKDAARGQPHVEYRLHKRRSVDDLDSYMLTVTDSNTSGLGGPILSFEDIQRRGNVLGRGDNWAAFEGMGYTKEDEDALGSRGQGKAAFLYHSDLLKSDPSSPQDRMIVLYDTLLADGTYRLGVRYASPFDTVLAPPLVGEEARRTVSSCYPYEDSREIELGLNPLSSVGTRIIVPHLSQEAVDSIHSGELCQWLQCCWWRAVQTGLSIDIVDELGITESVTVPAWWRDEPWKQRKHGVKAYENIDVAPGLKIKRIILLYDDRLDQPDMEDDVQPRFHGVQLLRGQQWIETLGVAAEFSDYVPRDRRAGFRGFVEFDRVTERELRRAETSQHESFDRRVSGVKTLIAAIKNHVKEFAKEQGWATEEVTRPASRGEQDAAMEFLRFLSPKARGIPSNGRVSPGSGQLEMDLAETEHWECDLRMDFPDPKLARVDWGQFLRNVAVEVKLEPPLSKPITVSLELAYADERTSGVPVGESQSMALQDGVVSCVFGDFQVITGRPASKKIQCARSGKYKLTAQIEANGTQVARSSRFFYVKEDPPARASRPYTVSISIENHTSRQRRISKGDIVGVQISVTNRTTEAQTLVLNASLGDSSPMLADMSEIETNGTPPGVSPIRVAGVQTQFTVNPTLSSPVKSINLPPGPHALRSDLFLNGEIVAHASRIVYVEVDPAQPDDWPPFKIEQISGEGHHPRWQLEKKSRDDWVLRYPPSYPLYRALGTSPSHGGARLSGVSAFVVDVCAEGIIEWAMEPLDNGDASRLDELLGAAPAGADPNRWETYCEKMRQLADLRGAQGEMDKYGQTARECAALSLSLFEERR